MAATTAKRVAAVFGAGGGLGWGIAQAFAASGYHVVLARRNEAALKELVASKTAGEDSVHSAASFSTLSCDVTDKAAVDAAFETIKVSVYHQLPACICYHAYWPSHLRLTMACRMWLL